MSRINCQKELVGDSVWVACSGGVDSIAIAHYIFKKLKREVKLFHFNHNLRPQNNKMEAAVVKFAEEFNLPIKICDAKWEEGELDNSISEALCREKRLKSISDINENVDIVLCHHLDDCVESYLMNCFNGVSQYSPIPPFTLTAGPRIVRPFLLTPKKAFQNYADAYNLNKFIIEDETNADTKYRRNWIRNECRPMIEEHYPGLKKVVLKKMEKHYENSISMIDSGKFVKEKDGSWHLNVYI